MFSTLIESSRKRGRAGSQSVVSLLLHLAAGVGVVQASRRIEPPERPRIYPMTPIAVASRHDPTPPAGAADPVGPAASAPVFRPEEFAPPVIAPSTIPPIDPGPAFDPRRLAEPPGPPGGCSIGCLPTAPADSVFRAETVDQPASIVSQPAPAYPAVLRAAGVGGRVSLEFTVDTAGRVEPGSIRSLEAVQEAFVAAAVAAVEASRFKPATVRGRPVRQLVRQAISFRIER